jgi:hypothetical protein
MQILGRILLGILVLISAQSFSQQLKGRVIIPKKTVYVGEACEVRIEVSTTTWFTSGVNPKNLQINGAYIIYFRPVSKTKRENGQTYSIVELIYKVFPYRSGELEFPSLEIEVESPLPGEYKGRKKQIRTKSKTIKIKRIPSDIEAKDWLVCDQLKVKDNWSGNLSEVKVGDVLTRTISRTASGTIPEMIPAFSWDTIEGASIYEGAVFAETNKGKLSISGNRSESIQYLFEKEGEIIIPAKTIYWWHRRSRKLYKKTLDSLVLNVQANPDLGILASIQDSLKLEAATVPALTNSIEKDIDWKGITKKFALGFAVFLILIYSAQKALPLVSEAIASKKRKMQSSEKFHFKTFIQTSEQDPQKLNRLYKWLSLLFNRTITLWELKDMLSEKELINEEDMAAKSVLGIPLNTSTWIRIRQAILKCKKEGKKKARSSYWINPTRRTY